MANPNAARDAFDHFHAGDYGKCDKLLDHISNAKSNADVKVSHNKLITEYYKSGCADPQNLLTQLSQAYDKARERDKKDKNRKKRDEDEEEAYREDEDLAVLRYNQALLCLQLRQHGQATLILEDLFENIEPIDDFLAIKICFLLLELCLVQRDLEQAVAVLAYLEKPQAFLTVLRNERQAQKAGASDESGEAKAGEAGKDSVVITVSEAAKGKGDGDAQEGPLPSLTLGAFLPKHGRAPDVISRAEYRFYCHMYRARVDMALKSTKAASKDAKNAMDVLDQDLKHSPLLTPHPHTTGKAKGDAGAAIQEGLQRQHQAIVNMFKAHLEYTRQNVRKAMRLLTLCQFNFAESHGPAENSGGKSKRKSHVDDDDEAIPIDFHPAQDDVCSPFFYNNLGCLHFLMHKPSLATFYFQKALTAMTPSSAPMSPGGLRLPGVLATRHWLDRRAEVAYNAGVQLLMNDRPAAALQCFEQCTPVFRSWPRLWMRMAECCIAVHRQSTAAVAEGQGEGRAALASGWSRLTSRHSASSMRNVVWGVQGAGANRRWLLSTSRDTPIGFRRGAEDEEGGAARADRRSQVIDGAAEEAERALLQAEMCLRNVLLLVGPMLPSDRSASTGADAADNAVGAAAAGAAAPAAAAAGARGAKAGSATGASPKAAGPPGGGTRAQARDLLESEYNLLEDSALVKLAYVGLCQRDYAGSLRSSRRLLEKNCSLAPATAAKANEEDDSRKNWSFQPQSAAQAAAATAGNGASRPVASSVTCVTLAVLYAAEALLMLARSQEARALLASFLRSNTTSHGAEALSTSGIEPHVIGTDPEPLELGQSDAARQWCGGLDPASSMGGFTPVSYILQCSGSRDRGDSKDDSRVKESNQAALVMYPPSSAPCLGEMQCMLYTNLAAVQVQDDNLKEAEAACEKALQVQPHALAPLRTLVYVLLRKGDNAEALRRLKQSRL